VIDQGRRVALVIEFRLSKRPSPAKSGPRADAIGRFVSQVGFQIRYKLSTTTREQLTKALRKFEDVAADRKLGVIYYGGHGIVINGENYLVPVDGKVVLRSGRARRGSSAEPRSYATEGAKKLRNAPIGCVPRHSVPDKMRQNDSLTLADQGLAAVEPGVGRPSLPYAARDGQSPLMQRPT